MDISEIRRQLREQAEETADRTLRPDTSAKTHSATKGLFAHIQANNLKSLLLLLVFLALAVLTQAMFNTVVDPLGDETNTFGPLFQSVTAQLELADGVAAEPAAETWRDELERLRDRFVEANSFGAMRSPLSWVVVAAALLHVLAGFVFSSVFVRRQTGAIPVSETEQRRLHHIVRTLTDSRGLPMPRLEVISGNGRNAYASGLHPRRSAIGVTAGLLDSLNDRELQAVMAHEIAHIEGRDNRLMTIANLSHGALTDFARRRVANFRASPLLFMLFGLLALYVLSMFPVLRISNLVLVAATALVVWAVSYATRNLVSRKREFRADAMAVEITKDPAALISALRKVAVNDRVDHIGRDVQAMMISNLSGEGAATHPEMAERIRAIESTTTVNAVDLAAVARMQSPADMAAHPAAGEGGGRPGGFGRRPAVQDVTRKAATPPALENEKLEGAYRSLQAAGRWVGWLESSLKTIVVILFAAPFVVVIPAAIAGSVISAVTGLDAKIATVLSLAFFLVWTVRFVHRKFNRG